jgi:hypothetical protein
MAVETSPGKVTAQQAGASKTGRPAGATNRESRVLLPGERVIAELDSDGDNYFQLTGSRVIFSGGGSQGGAVFASVQLKDIASVQISNRPRARRSAAWGVIGLFSAIGVWQVTPNSTIGIAAALVVALISLVLMADYWIRPAGVHIEFHSVGGKIEGEVGGKAAHALAFVKQVEDERRRLVPGRASAPFRNYPSG